MNIFNLPENNMKHYLLPLAFIVLITVHSYGQEKPFSVVVNAGVNLSNARENTNTYTGIGDKRVKWGYQVGFQAEYVVAKSVYLQSGLSLTTKGTRHVGAEVWIGGSNPPVTYWESTTNQVYLQLPVRLGYKISVSSQVKIRFNAGLYAAYGVGGKETIKEKTRPSSVREDQKLKYDTFGDGDRRYSPYNLKRQDYGISLGVGAEYKKAIVGLDYEAGLLNITKPDGNDLYPLPVDYRNRNLSLTVGYIF